MPGKRPLFQARPAPLHEDMPNFCLGIHCRTKKRDRWSRIWTHRMWGPRQVCRCMSYSQVVFVWMSCWPYPHSVFPFWSVTQKPLWSGGFGSPVVPDGSWGQCHVDFPKWCWIELPFGKQTWIYIYIYIYGHWKLPIYGIYPFMGDFPSKSCDASTVEHVHLKPWTPG